MKKFIYKKMIHNEKVILYFLHKIALDLDRTKILY